MPRTSCTCCGSTWSDGSRRRPRRPSSARSGSGAGVGEARRSRRPPGAAFRDRDHLSLPALEARGSRVGQDRKSTRLNSSHLVISYAVFCLKKKKHKEAKMTLHLQRVSRFHQKVNRKE